MSDPGPLDNPFGGLPFFGDLAKMLQGQGPLSWDAARHLALVIATEGKPEVNVDPADRMRWADLGRIAELQVQVITGLDTTVGGRAVEVVPVTPGVWAARALDAYRPLFERLAGSLGRSVAGPDPGDPADPDDPTAMIAGMMQLMSPVLLGMSAGSMIGHLARRSFGQYDLPIPRPPAPELQVVEASVARFADDWSLPLDDVRLWVCLQELTLHAVLAVPHVRAALEELLSGFVAGFRPDPRALEDRLGDVEPSAGMGMFGDLQRALGDPEVLLGAITSPEQEALRPRLDALVATVIGYADHVVDRGATALLGSGGRIGEAVRRRRVETDQADVFVERLLGLSLSQTQVDRGSAFVEGVLERSGEEGLARLWASARVLPTPAEVDAPGLWLARIDLPDEP